MLHPKTYGKLRRDIEKNTDDYVEKALNFVIHYLSWNYDERYKVRVRKLSHEEFSKYYPGGRLAGQMEVTETDREGKKVEFHHVHFDWERLTDTENNAFVLEFVRCSIHEILEIYFKQTGIRYVHLPPDVDKFTEKETEVVHRFSEEILGIPKDEFDEYIWKDTRQ